jgi:hypothetical protein
MCFRDFHLDWLLVLNFVFVDLFSTGFVYCFGLFANIFGDLVQFNLNFLFYLLLYQLAC